LSPFSIPATFCHRRPSPARAERKHRALAGERAVLGIVERAISKRRQFASASASATSSAFSLFMAREGGDVAQAARDALAEAPSGTSEGI